MKGVVLFFVSVLLGDLRFDKKPVGGLWVPCSCVRTFSQAYTWTFVNVKSLYRYLLQSNHLEGNHRLKLERDQNRTR